MIVTVEDGGCNDINTAACWIFPCYIYEPFYPTTSMQLSSPSLPTEKLTCFTIIS